MFSCPNLPKLPKLNTMSDMDTPIPIGQYALLWENYPKKKILIPP